MPHHKRPGFDGRVVSPSRLRVGDEIMPDTITRQSVFVEELYRDDYGTWIEWSDGDMGYVDPDSKYLVINEGDLP